MTLGELEVVRLLLPRVFVQEGPGPFKEIVRGMEGTIVHVHPGGRAFEVEFASDDGETLGVVTLEEGQIEATGKVDP